jgi:subfamily B ATP-binding cassette protein MsbA
MFIETAMSLAAPWPLKIIIDSVVGKDKLSPWLLYWVGPLINGVSRIRVAGFAALALVLMAAIGALASYIDNYYTESVGQWVAHDLRLRTYDHLQRLSLNYYNTHATGTIVSTITTDIQTIQGFASASTLDILVDLLTILCMLGLMFWLNWDFTLIAVSITPFLLLFVSRFKKAVNSATREVRKDQSQIVAVVEESLENMQAIKAFGHEKAEVELLGAVSHATINAALKARKLKALLAPVVTITVAVCTAIVLWRGTALILSGAMTVGSLTVYLNGIPRLSEPLFQAGEGSGHHNQCNRAGDRWCRAHPRSSRC